jgi:uncharacterized protein (TIGR02246 family)
MRQMILVACIAGVLTAGFGPAAIAADANTDAVREVRDRAEIEALMWRYVRALDTLNESAYADVYAPDGTFGTGAEAVTGREALKKVVADIKKRHAAEEAKAGEKHGKMHHIVTNTYLEFLGKDRARLNYYWIQVFEAPREGMTPRVAAAGRGVDELARVNGKWLIKLRNVTPTD